MTFNGKVAFSVSFAFKISSGGGDGLTFSIVGGSPNIVGGFGRNLGYSGTPSIAVKFDTVKNTGEPSDNYIAFLKDGNALENLAFKVESTLFKNNQVWYVWIDYDSSALYVRYSQSSTRPTLPLLSSNIDLSNLLNINTYFGFTASTSSLASRHEIVEFFYFTNTMNSFGLTCDPGNYYNFATGQCSICADGFINTGQYYYY